MEIRHLKLVKAIVEEGSMSKASNVLHLTQSALSHQLKELEEYFKVSLFERNGKKLILTDAGQKVYDTANKVLNETQNLKEEIKKYTSGKKGTIKISTSCYTSYHWLPSLLEQFKKDYPEIEVNINVDITGKTREKLLSNEIDIAIVSVTEKNSPFNYRLLFRDEMVALVNSDHTWNNKKYVTARDFNTENLIIHSRPLNTVTVYREVLQPENTDALSYHVLPLTEAAIEMIRAGYGVAVMSRWAVKPYLDEGKVQAVKVTPKGLFRNNYAVLLKNREYPSYFDAFIDNLRNNIPGLS